MVLFHISIVKFMSNGLFGNAISKFLSSTCYHTGWATLTFLTGYVPDIQKVSKIFWKTKICFLL